MEEAAPPNPKLYSVYISLGDNYPSFPTYLGICPKSELGAEWIWSKYKETLDHYWKDVQTEPGNLNEFVSKYEKKAMKIILITPGKPFHFASLVDIWNAEGDSAIDFSFDSMHDLTLWLSS